MANYSAEDARKKYDTLPQEIKNLLYSPEMSFTVQQIGQKNHLHIDQIDVLNTEIGQVMLGFLEPKDFVPALMEMLKLDHSQAEAVAKDVNDMLFLKIRDAMKNMGGQISTPQPPTTSPTPKPVPPAATTTPTPPASAPKPQVPMAPHPHDLMLVEKTITTPPKNVPTPSKPENYKTDPYREPVEP